MVLTIIRIILLVIIHKADFKFSFPDNEKPFRRLFKFKINRTELQEIDDNEQPLF